MAVRIRPNTSTRATDNPAHTGSSCQCFGNSVTNAGKWSATDAFAPAFDEALKRKGIRLLHCKTDVEVISNATTISTLREKAKAR